MATGESFTDLDVCENNQSFVESLLEESSDDKLNPKLTGVQREQTSEIILKYNPSTKEDPQKLYYAVWTSHATSTLVKLYDEKLRMLETPKKKTRIWRAISENLKDYDIEVTPDQVRWKINALTKKYKRCIDMGKHEKFKYFKEMDNIYAKYNVDCDSYSITEYLSKQKFNNELINKSTFRKTIPETKAMIQMRKARLANRIDCDRFQGKIKLERQWLEYLHKQEEKSQWRDKILERNLKLKEEELQTRKRELEIKESIEYKKLRFMETEQDDLLRIEREKCELLKQMINRNV